MTRPVVVREVEITSFGGVQHRTVRFPDHPFVVVAGPNEAGKTTMATVLSWLLAGPTDAARRFGSADDVLEGILRGTFGGDIFTSSAAFKVPEVGVPDDSVWKVLHRSPLTAGGWRATIGGIDATVVSAIYRLWGADLHDGHIVDEELSRVALGAYGGRIDATNLATQMSQLAQEMLAMGAHNGPSLQGIQAERDFLQRQLDEARRSVAEYTAVQREIEAVAEERAAAVAALAALEREVLDLERALAAHPLYLRARKCADEVSALAPVPGPWRIVATRSNRIATILAGQIDLSSRHQAAVEAIERSSRAGVFPLGEGLEAEVSDEHRIEFGRLVSSLRSLDTERADVERRVRDSQGSLETAAGELNGALASLSTQAGVPVSREVLASARVDPQATGLLLEAAATWRQAQVNAEQVRPRQAAAQETLDKLSLTRKRSPLPLVLWFVALGSGIVAGAAVVANVPAVGIPAAGGTLLMALVATVVSLGIRRSRAVPFDARFAEARREFESSTETLRQAELGVMRAQQSLQRMALEFGHLSPSHPNAMAPTLIVWTEAADLLAKERSADASLADSRTALVDVDRRTAAVEESIRAVIRECRMPEHIPLRTADEAAAQVQQLSRLRSEASELASELTVVTAELASLLEPVWSEVRGWTPEQIEGHLHSVVAQITVEDRAIESRNLAERDLAVATEDRPAILSLLESHPDVSSLERAHTAAVSQVHANNERVRVLSERSGQLAERLRDLDLREVLAPLVARDGTLAELERTLVGEVVATAIAAHLLRRAVEDYVRTHQPGIVARTSELVRLIAPAWDCVEVGLADPESSGPSMTLSIRARDGRLVPSQRLSTGARALLYLALRVAMADHDGDQRGVAFPLICDDPLVHMDDVRASAAVTVLAEAATRRQVFLMTCHDRTVQAATAAGAEVLAL